MKNEELIRIWEKAVDTQMHFNEMSVKSRQLGLTFATAALGVAVVLFSNGSDFYIDLGTFHAHISGLIMFAAAAAIGGVSTLDLKVYHKMLRGAVAFGEDLENNHLKTKLKLDMGMTQAISHFSRHPNASVKLQDGTSKYKYLKGSGVKNAGNKIEIFYWLVIGSLVLVGIVTLWAGHLRYDTYNSGVKPSVVKMGSVGSDIKTELLLDSDAKQEMLKHKVEKD